MYRYKNFVKSVNRKIIQGTKKLSGAASRLPPAARSNLDNERL